jgi:hypothetical protein
MTNGRQMTICNQRRAKTAPDEPGRFSQNKSERPGTCKEPGRVNLPKAALESLLQSDVPEPAFDGGQRFVVAVLKAAGDEGRILVGDILHPKRDGRAV